MLVYCPGFGSEREPGLACLGPELELELDAGAVFVTGFASAVLVFEPAPAYKGFEDLRLSSESFAEAIERLQLGSVDFAERVVVSLAAAAVVVAAAVAVPADSSAFGTGYSLL